MLAPKTTEDAEFDELGAKIRAISLHWQEACPQSTHQLISNQYSRITSLLAHRASTQDSHKLRVQHGRDAMKVRH